MRYLKNLFFCITQTNIYINKNLQVIQNRFKNIQLINYTLNKCISCNKQEITLIFLKISSNLSLYQSDRYDKNLSLIYIWPCQYIYFTVLKTVFWTYKLLVSASTLAYSWKICQSASTLNNR